MVFTNLRDLQKDIITYFLEKMITLLFPDYFVL